MKKNSKKKGFTLIELIVVIAILGILAAIAIPRLSGFSDKAKKQADDQYAALVANATMTMIAAGDISIADETKVCTITFDATADDGSVTGISNITYGTKITDLTTYNTELLKLVAKKAPVYYKTAFSVELDAAGTKTVKGSK